MMSDNIVVPFGKYRGKPIQETLTDREYWEYISAQPWFKEKFVNIYNIVHSLHETDNTPEHNRIQIMFLDKEFVKAILKIAPNDGGNSIGFEVGKPYHPYLDRYGKILTGAPIDVCIGREHLDAQGNKYWDGTWIEVKSTVGDDYPAILRQMATSGAEVLLTEKYIGQGATLEQVRAFFATAGKKVVLLEEVLQRKEKT